MFGGYHEYTDVKSCQDVVHLHHLLWSATILNIVALFLGIITAAVLGSFKDMVGRAKTIQRKHPAKYVKEKKLSVRDTQSDPPSSSSCQTPAVASESTSEPEAITAPVPSELPARTASLQRHTAPCLPPYTAYDLQVRSFLKPAWMLDAE